MPSIHALTGARNFFTVSTRKQLFAILLCFTQLAGAAIDKNKTTSSTLAQQPVEIQRWQERKAALAHLENWRLEGKVAVQTGRDSCSATVNWVQRHNHYTVSLLGPMGSNGMRLSGRPGSVTLMTANGKQYRAATPEKLLANQWGFNLPISYLMYWIRGLPVAGLTYRYRLDNRHRLSYLSQQGWHIQYQNYIHRDEIDLPTRIMITSDRVKSKIIIYQWQTDIKS